MTCISVPDLDAMQTLDPDPSHFISDRAISIAGKPVNTGADQEMGAGGLGHTEQFVDVAFAVANMDAPCRITHQTCGLTKIFQPMDAFLLLDRNPGRIDLPLERGCSLEFVPGPELDGRQPQRQAIGCDGQAGMHHNAADRAGAQPTLLVLAAVDALGDADRLRPHPSGS